jgi:hypothetical protein
VTVKKRSRSYISTRPLRLPPGSNLARTITCRPVPLGDSSVAEATLHPLGELVIPFVRMYRRMLDEAFIEPLVPPQNTQAPSVPPEMIMARMPDTLVSAAAMSSHAPPWRPPEQRAARRGSVGEEVARRLLSDLAYRSHKLQGNLAEVGIALVTSLFGASLVVGLLYCCL